MHDRVIDACGTVVTFSPRACAALVKAASSAMRRSSITFTNGTGHARSMKSPQATFPVIPSSA
jgi:hypothetical protein